MMSETVALEALPASARQILRHVAVVGAATRPSLASTLSLSKPTVSSATDMLERLGMLSQVDTKRGPTGRHAAIYGLGDRAGCVIAVDVGMSRVTCVAARLDGSVLHESSSPRRSRGRAVETLAKAAMAQIQKVHARAVRPGLVQVRAIVVAAPHTIVRAGAEDDGAADAFGPLAQRIRALIGDPGLPVIIENNVNCAAVAERQTGAAAGCQDFVVLQLGVGVGLGIVVGGALVTGAHGVAGEPAYLPMRIDGQTATTAGPTDLEEYIGAKGWIRRIRLAWPDSAGPAPRDTSTLFRRAEDPRSTGHTHAREEILGYAREVGCIARSVSAFLDPALIILGGGIGSNQALVPGVTEGLRTLPCPPRVACSTMGQGATIVGATCLATQTALDAMLTP